MKTPEMPKAYEPAKYEADMYSLWEESDAFKPNPEAPKDPFCIILPPPNANGHIHTGTAMFTIEDIMIRYKRMQGHKTLWLPGTDHAGIETQVVYERELARDGKSRFDFSRQQFYDDVMAWTKENQSTIISELKSMGFSLDWSRLKFTLDGDIVAIVCETFKLLHDKGYVYRGNRIVNWCPHCRSAFADIEIKHREQIDPLYYIKYGPFVLATVRLETKFGDTAVAVNPKDERYTKWVGKEIEAENVLGEKFKLKVIADDHVDPEFGTGVVKVTPAHDPNDWEMGQRHNLEVKQVIGTDGRLTDLAGKYAGTLVAEARQAIAEDMEARGLMDHIDMNYTHSIAYHDRCGTTIEPLVVEQWWLKVDELKKPAIAAIKSGAVEFVPKRFTKVALDWLNNLHDWNISRQNWWGIRVPVYYNATTDTSKPDYIIATDEKEAIAVYGKNGYEAETDNFDTWFSSGQWPFATLMATGDFDEFYPTSVMETGRDILFLWVTRMVMFGEFRTDHVPFKTVYLHGLINDEHGKKMSKSKGNVINPLDFTAKYGTDALRLALTIGITPGNDGALAEAKVAGYRNFCNKLWNVARYTLSVIDGELTLDDLDLKTPADHWILGQVNTAIKSVTKDIDNYKFSEAGQKIYSLLWDDLADKYLEYSKSQLNPGVLAYSLDTILRLLHPIAPFVTEAIWQELPWTTTNLITEHWPKVIHKSSTDSAKLFELEIIKILSAKQKDQSKVEILKLQKELALKQNLIKITQAKLSNDAFAQNAPKELVAGERAKLKATQSETKKLEAEIEKLSKW